MTPSDRLSFSPFKFNDWLTLKDAAKVLATAFDGDVSESDVLRLALDGRLIVSVDFVNKAYANLGRVEPAADSLIVSPDQDEELVPRRVILWRGEESSYGVLISDQEVVRLDSAITTVQGLWDLSLLGCERLDVLHEYHRLNGGPAVQAAGGPYLTLVNRADGSWAQLLMPMDAPAPSSRLAAETLSLKRPLLDIAWTNDFEGAQMLGEIPDVLWSLALGLPLDCVFVVRTDSLSQMIAAERSNTDRRASQTPTKTPNVPSGDPVVLSSWSELTVRFLSDERVQLHIGHQSRETLNYAEFGFEDRRDGKQAQAWSTFLLLAEKGGTLTLADLAGPASRPRVEKHLQQMRRALRQRFPQLEGDPLPWQGDRYKAQFGVSRAKASDT